ncbi:MAG: thioredoxin domain-containing protein [Saprospiraceae bacterium]|nr:thioredoxin domain-containing protein [Candidatus Vicinibacter affinis]
MIRACIDASAALNNKEYLNSAIKAADLIKNRMWDPQNGLYRNFKNGQKNINGFLEDYSFTIDAFIRLYEMSFDESYLLFAKQLTDVTIQNFSDQNNVFFYFNSKLDKQLISRKMDFEDQVTPSANSVMADNLYRLGLFFYNNEYLERSKKMILSATENFGEGQTEFYSNWTRLYISLLKPYYEVAVVGPNSKELRNELAMTFLPSVILLGGTTEGTLELLKDKLQEGNTFIYVCRNKVCKIPVTNAAEALKLID